MATIGPYIPYFFSKKKDGTTQNRTRQLRKVEFELAKQYPNQKVPAREMLSAINSYLQYSSDAKDQANRNQLVRKLLSNEVVVKATDADLVTFKNLFLGRYGRRKVTDESSLP